MLKQSIVVCCLVCAGANQATPAESADPITITRAATIGETYTVEATVGRGTDVIWEKADALRPDAFTIPRGYKASHFVYHWSDPATGAQSNRIAATTVYSLSKGRYMTELKSDADAMLPAGNYRLIVGGTPGATARLTYTLDFAERPDDSETASLRRLWYGIVDFRNACVDDGDGGWKQFADETVLQHVGEINRRIWKSDSPAGWSYFFSLAMFDLGNPSSETPIVAFYHPWADVWLFTEWELRPVAKIVGIEILCGEYVRRRGQLPLDLQVDWLKRDGFRVEQLSRAVVDNLNDFQKIAYAKPSWRDALLLNDRTFEAQEFNDWTVTVQLSQAWLRAGEIALGSPAFPSRNLMPPVLERLITSYKQFLDAGSVGDLSPWIDQARGTHPSTAETIGRLPRNVFDRFNPTYWLADERYAQVYLALDRNPDYCLALTYSRETDELRLERIDFVHFPMAARVMQKKGSP